MANLFLGFILGSLLGVHIFLEIGLLYLLQGLLLSTSASICVGREEGSPVASSFHTCSSISLTSWMSLSRSIGVSLEGLGSSSSSEASKLSRRANLLDLRVLFLALVVFFVGIAHGIGDVEVPFSFGWVFFDVEDSCSLAWLGFLLGQSLIRCPWAPQWKHAFGRCLLTIG